METSQTEPVEAIASTPAAVEPIKAGAIEFVKTEIEVDILKAIYTELSAQLKFTSERSFTSTIQTITLNLVVLGGLIVNKIALSYQAKLLGSIMLVAFNASILSYIFSKGTGYAKVKKELLAVRSSLANRCSSLNVNIIQATLSKTAFFKGTGMMFLAVAISCICTICGLWLPLTEVTNQPEVDAKPPVNMQPAANPSMPDTMASPTR